MLNRKEFLRYTTMAAGSMLVPFGNAFAHSSKQKLVILHTNDTHSRLDPFPMDGSRNQGMGGVAARARLISEIRNQEEHVLLLDAGDIFQGTPYFNLYKGEPEMKAMEWMKYDACTMGNHDFDGGLTLFADQLKHVQFPVLICNYDFSETPMSGKTKPYQIFRKGNLKIGVTGVGIELSGLVPDSLIGNTRYLDPVASLNRTASKLKNEKGCDLVICLSHLGFEYKNDPAQISDVRLAAATEDVDIIIGGHTHTFLQTPVSILNKKGKNVLINQVGWGGLVLGRIDLEFLPGQPVAMLSSEPVLICKKTSE
jgi:5'-nucleotidase